MRRRVWIEIAAAAVVAVVILAATTPAATRYYWPLPVDTLAIGHPKHTHVAVRGRVDYTRLEADGDLHIRLVSPAGRFIIAECMPELPCSRPAIGDTITVLGITRQDPEHLWWEVHPVESWTR